MVLPFALWLLPEPFSLAVVLVYAWILWDPLHQGLHDKLAGTLVIRAR